MAENKTLCIACKYKFHDRDLQPCADCLRSTQLAQQGIDRYQRAAQPQQASPASETRKAHPAARRCALPVSICTATGTPSRA